MDSEKRPFADLDEILSDYVDRLNSGERLNPEEVLAEHPEHHGWRDGLSPEQRQEMLDFERENYESRGAE